MKTRTKVIAGILVVLLSASLAVSCYMIWSELSQQKKEKDIFSQLAERLGCQEAFTEGLDEMGWNHRRNPKFKTPILRKKRYRLPCISTILRG